MSDFDRDRASRIAQVFRCPAHPEIGRLAWAEPRRSRANSAGGGRAALVCSACDRRYLVHDDIPDLFLGQDRPDDFLEVESRQWDDQAHRYDDKRTQDARYMAGVQAAVRALQVRPGEMVLDAACGTGLTIRSYLSPNVRVVGLDLSLASLHQLRRRLNGDRVDLVRGELSRLPFGDATFDRVLCANAMQHIPDVDQRRLCISELARVARPNARVVITAHNWSVPRQSAGWVKEGSAGGHSGQLQYIYRYEPDEFHRLIGSALHVERLAAAGFPLPYRLKLSPISRVMEHCLGKLSAAVAYGDMLVGICRNHASPTQRAG